MCGIIAYAGSDYKKYNEDKLKLLGVLNETRGRDSCGISVDGEIFHGVDKNKVFRDFISNMIVPVPKEIPTVIGHTRWSTVGANTADNAHPFGFGDCQDGEKFAFVGVHNGTLLNHKALGTKYGISLAEETSNKVYRSLIDSEILLAILHKTGNFKVLSEYQGAAATVFYNVEEPNVVYCYHGKSAEYEGEPLAVEERPLWYYKESKNSLYISSLEASLYAIGGDKDNIESFDYNTVYKITDGDVDNAVKTKISRLTNYQKEAKWGHKKAAQGGTNSSVGFPRKNSSTAGKNTTTMGANSPSKKSTWVDDCLLGNIYQEKNPQNEKKGAPYFYKLRYWENGHKLDGFYTHIAGYGFYYLGHHVEHAEQSFWGICNLFFKDGYFWKHKDLSAEEKQTAFIPFVHNRTHSIEKVPIHAFYEGIRLETLLDYQPCFDMADKGKPFPIERLSLAAMHPVISLDYKYRSIADQEIWYRGLPADGIYFPLGADKIYDIEEGNLQEVAEPFKRGNSSDLNIVREVDDVMDEINKADKLEFFEDDLVSEEITEMFLTSFTSFPKFKKRLEDHLPNPLAQCAIDVIDTFIAGTYKLLEVEPKE